MPLLAIYAGAASVMLDPFFFFFFFFIYFFFFFFIFIWTALIQPAAAPGRCWRVSPRRLDSSGRFSSFVRDGTIPLAPAPRTPSRESRQFCFDVDGTLYASGPDCGAQWPAKLAERALAAARALARLGLVWDGAPHVQARCARTLPTSRQPASSLARAPCTAKPRRQAGVSDGEMERAGLDEWIVRRTGSSIFHTRGAPRDPRSDVQVAGPRAE
jgi:hypothetical protein